MNKTSIKRHFLTGVFATLPLFSTIYILYLIYVITAGIVKMLLPIDFITKILISSNSRLANRESTVAFVVFLISIIFLALIIYISGLYINKFINIGTSKFINRLINRIPIAKSIYSIFKQISGVIFSSEKTKYKKSVIIQYPRDGLYVLGLVANEQNTVVATATGEKEMYNIYVPTTPNPTTGFFVIMPKEDVIEVDYTVEEVFKLVISAGALEPDKIEIIKEAGE